jgi:hypothetical protein
MFSPGSLSKEKKERLRDREKEGTRRKEEKQRKGREEKERKKAHKWRQMVRTGMRQRQR